MEAIKQLLQNFKIPYQHLATYVEAFTHPTYANEHGKSKWNDYERLEFLGDAVVYQVVTYYLYTTFSELPEGKLTPLRAALVEENTLAELARQLHFDDYMLLGIGAQKKDSGRESKKILADVFEAFIGALRHDLGFDAAQQFLVPLIQAKLATKPIEDWIDVKDAKTRLQEYVQGIDRKSVTYVVTKELGPAHERLFEVEVRLDDIVWGVGKGRSKQLAEQEAAKNALSKMAGVQHG